MLQKENKYGCKMKNNRDITHITDAYTEITLILMHVKVEVSNTDISEVIDMNVTKENKYG